MNIQKKPHPGTLPFRSLGEIGRCKNTNFSPFDKFFPIFPIAKHIFFIFATDKVKFNMNSEMIHKLQDCLSTLPIEKAWLFGSYSRGEERPDSDIDLLVRFDEDARISLFKYASIILTLEAAMGKDVDLVQEGSLLPFAVKTAEKDKILIYERAD